MIEVVIIFKPEYARIHRMTRAKYWSNAIAPLLLLLEATQPLRESVRINVRDADGVIVKQYLNIAELMREIDTIQCEDFDYIQLIERPKLKTPKEK
jgi:hypothetical protein